MTISSANKPSVPYVVDFYRQVDYSKEEQASIKQTKPNGLQVTYQLPRFGKEPFNTNEDLLHTIKAFRRLAEQLNWDDDDCKDVFPTVLQPQVASKWTNIASSAPVGTTFHDMEQEFIQAFVTEPDAFLSMQTYMRTVHLTRAFTVTQFFDRIQHVCDIVELLPQAQGMQLMTERDQLLTAFNGCPTKWQAEHYKQHRSLHTETFDTLKEFMVRMESIDKMFNKDSSKPTDKSNQSNGKSRHGNSRTNSSRAGNDRSRSNYNSGGSRNTGATANPNDSDMPCPFKGHSNHKWKDCKTFNPNAQGYRGSGGRSQGHQGQRYTGHSQGSSQARNQSNQDNRQQSHYNEVRPTTASNTYDSDVGDNHHYELQLATPTQANNHNSRFFDAFHYDFQFAEEEGYESQDAFELDSINESLPDLIRPKPEDHDTDSDEEDEANTTRTDKTNRTDKILEEDKAPSTLTSVISLGGKRITKTLVSLLDSGATCSMINARVIPKGAITTTETKASFATTAGNLKTNQSIKADKVSLLEFTRALHIKDVKFFVFNEPSIEYDIIFGRDFLKQAGIKLDFTEEQVQWMDFIIPMKPRHYWSPNAIDRALKVQPQAIKEAEAHTTTVIKESDYHEKSIEEVVAQQKHLSTEQRNDLYKMLLQFKKLFSGKLGIYPHKEFSLELLPNAVPHHSKPYAVPHVHLPVFKKELHRLVDIGVLRPAGATDWAAGTFVIPKKNQQVRWVSDFRHLNKWIKRKQYPLPKIQRVVQDQRPYKYLTKIDVSMQYYTFRLDKASQELCTIVTPFGKYHYNVLPMGVCQSPDWSQATMEEIFRDLIDSHGVVVYIDDIKITSTDWKHHMWLVQECLKRLQDNGFTVTPSKCEWAVQETDFLGFWFTPNGVKPWPKKITATLALAPPTNRTQVRALCGAITFYRDMYPKRAHILAPITKLQSKDVPFQWTEECQKAFDTIKALIAQDVLLAYPDPNEPFEIYTDASDLQLGAVIKQHGKPVAFYSRKLTPTQQRYTTIEKELLSAVETFKEFRSFLLGAPITVYTDHMNLVHTVEHANDRILRWRLYLEDFHPTFIHLKGQDNTIADGLSRAPLQERQTGPMTDAASSDLFFALDLFIFYPPDDPQDNTGYPMDFDTIAQAQDQDQALIQARARNPDQYTELDFPTANGLQTLLCYRRNAQDEWRICIPQDLLPAIVNWYHHVLGHVGSDRLYRSISSHFYCPQIKEYCNYQVSNCQDCRQYKATGPGYGQLPEKILVSNPFDEVSVDLIGPWAFTAGPNEYVFHALVCIDPATNLSEIISLLNKESAYVALRFEDEWLSRYPRPLRCIHDNGTEFTGAAFQQMLNRNGIRSVPTTVKNPQSNAINERLHLTIQDILRTYLNKHKQALSQPLNTQVVIDHVLAATRYALRSAIHKALGISPGSMVFARDMFLPIPVMADFQALRQVRQAKINRNLLQANQRRRFHDYQVNDQVYILNKDIKRKLSPTTQGPFPITEVHTNGTVVIQRRPHVFERINIRRIKPAA